MKSLALLLCLATPAAGQWVSYACPPLNCPTQCYGDYCRPPQQYYYGPQPQRIPPQDSTQPPQFEPRPEVEPDEIVPVKPVPNKDTPENAKIVAALVLIEARLAVIEGHQGIPGPPGPPGAPGQPGVTPTIDYAKVAAELHKLQPPASSPAAPAEPEYFYDLAPHKKN